MPNGTEIKPKPANDFSDLSDDEIWNGLVSEDLDYKKKNDPDEQKGRIKIQINNNPLDEQTNLAINALYNYNRPPKLFSRACMISRIRYDEFGVAFVEPLKDHTLRYYLARCAYFVKITAAAKQPGEFNETHFSPPMDVVNDVLAIQDTEFPQLLGLSEIPIIRPDGAVASRPGYDVATSLYFAPSNGSTFPDVPETPTEGDIITSINLLKEVICDFPFVDGVDGSNFANAFAAMITPVLRPIIPGCVPMAILDKPQAGTGASLLCDVVSIIASGHEMATITEQKSEEEWVKVIVSLLRSGRTLVTVDNVEGKLYAPAIASLLTAATFQGRILGRTEMATFPNKTVWVANGNNIHLGGDLPRRCFWIRMDAKTAQPWMRKIDYKHPALREWVHDKRGWIVCSILTIARAWIQAGCPPPKSDTCKILGGFEGWCTVIGGILDFCNIPGFLGNLDEMYENLDQDTLQWENFLCAWRTIYAERSVSVAEIYSHLKAESDSTNTLSQSQELYSTIPDWLLEEFSKKQSFTRKLGKALGRYDGVCFNCGLKLEKSGEKRHVILWRVVVWDQPSWERRIAEERLATENGQSVTEGNKTL